MYPVLFIPQYQQFLQHITAEILDKSLVKWFLHSCRFEEIIISPLKSIPCNPFLRKQDTIWGEAYLDTAHRTWWEGSRSTVVRTSGYTQKNLVGLSNLFPKTFTLFTAKICDLWPDQKFDTLYQIWPLHVHHYPVSDLPYNGKVASSHVSSEKHTQFKTRVQKPYPTRGQKSQNRYPISDQNG